MLDLQHWWRFPSALTTFLIGRDPNAMSINFSCYGIVVLHAQ